MEETALWSELLPRPCIGKKEVRLSWLECPLRVLPDGFGYLSLAGKQNGGRF